MKKIRLILLALTAFVFVSAKDKDCKKEFAGKWKYFDTPASQIYVLRTLDKHIEYLEDGKYYDEYSISWVSDCKFELRFKSTTNPSPTVAEIGEVTVIEILSIDNKKMKYKSTLRGQSETSEMARI